MATLVADNLRVTRGPAVVLDGISLTVAPRHRVGVVGPNGVGKSTLLQTLAGTVALDGGSVNTLPPTALVGYLAQEPERRPGESVRQFLSRRTGVSDAEAELEAAAAALADATDTSADRSDQALHRWLDLGAADLDQRAEQVCEQCGLGAELLDREMSVLSGGEAARAGLAAVLLSRFDIFLLDEPTNDLDVAGLALLESFVLSLDAPVVVVSHDRRFLSATITEVLELDERHRAAALFGGGWDAYLDARDVARRHAEEAYESYADKRSDLSGQAQRIQEWSAKGALKAQKRPKDNDKIGRKLKVASSEQLAGKASRAERQLERLETVEKPWEPWQLRLELKVAPRSGAVMARLSQAVIERGDFRLGPIDVAIDSGERVRISGPNGSGKSTLIDALLGRQELASGSHWMGPGVIVGELDQRRTALSGDHESLLEAFRAETGMLEPEARTLLAKFGLVRDHVLRATDTLSPGERTRALLALFMATGTNCLILDEPTNHLDLPAIEQLEVALETWTGTLIVVTHDRAFADAISVDREIILG